MKTKLLLLIIVTLYSLSGKAQYTKLHDFGSATDGVRSDGTLYSDGVYLYGMTRWGGVGNCQSGCGTIFKIKPDGMGYVKLYDFYAANGQHPGGSLISDGTFLYGMTNAGGAAGKGVVFKIKMDGTGYMNLLEFNGVNGQSPIGSLISDGIFLYGMTSEGGANNMGLIFKVKSDGTGYMKLLDFEGALNGRSPRGSLITDGTSLYGTTAQGGVNDLGVIFKIHTDGSSFSKLWDFNGADGKYPSGSLISDGTFLYGMTIFGGAINQGSLYKIKPDGTGFVKLFDFNGSNGRVPFGSIIIDGTFLYGMTYNGGAINLGVLFKIKPDGTGYINLYDFNGSGYQPSGSLISDGTFFYGMTEKGGANDGGVIFKYGLTTGIRENNLEKDLMLYPNPTTGQFQISSGELAITDLQIYNVLGEMVYEKSLDLKGENKITVSLPSSLSNGIYFVELKTEQGTLKKKIVVNR